MKTIPKNHFFIDGFYIPSKLVGTPYGVALLARLKKKQLDIDAEIIAHDEYVKASSFSKKKANDTSEGALESRCTLQMCDGTSSAFGNLNPF